MPLTVLAPDARFRGFDSNGAPLNGGKLFTYAAGTATKTATYTDSTGNTPNANPVVLDANGYADVWFVSGTAMKLVLSPSTDSDPPTSAFWTVDNITVVSATGSFASLSGNNAFTGNNTFGTGTLTLNSVATFNADPTIASPAAGPTVAPNLTLFHNQPSPAQGDIAGNINFAANNTTPAQKSYGSIDGVVQFPTPGQESGALAFNATINGAQVQVGLAGVIQAGNNISGGFQIQGDQAGANAPTGYVGEFFSAGIPGTGALPLVNNTPKMLTSLTLPAGDWDVWANPTFTGGITTSVTSLTTAISTTIASIGGTSATGQRADASYPNYNTFPAAAPNINSSVGPFRANLSFATTYYMNLLGLFTNSTLSGFGLLQARRRR